MRMLSSARVLVIASAALLFTTAIPTPVQAVPGSDIVTMYYDCALNEVGIKYRSCNGGGSNSGQLSGYFKEIDATSCEDNSYSDNWYKWDGSFWVYLPGGQPSPEC
jgi:hypothetical protein